MLKHVEKKKSIVVGRTWRAVINLRKKGADVRHSPACSTSEQHLEKQDAYVAPGYLIFQTNTVSMMKSTFIFQMSSVMDGTIFLYFVPFCTF